MADFLGGLLGDIPDPQISPTVGGLLGAASAYAPSLEYSRMPHNATAGLLQALGGFGQGYLGTQRQQAQAGLLGAQTQDITQQIQQRALGNAMALWRMDAGRAAMARQPMPPFDLQKYMGMSLSGGGAAPSPFSAPPTAGGGIPQSFGGALGGAAPSPQPAPAAAAGTGQQGAAAGDGPDYSEVQRQAFIQDVLNPGAGKEFISAAFAPKRPGGSGINPLTAGWENFPVLPQGVTYQNGRAVPVPDANTQAATLAGIEAGAHAAGQEKVEQFKTGLTKAEWQERDPKTGEISTRQGTVAQYLAAQQGGRLAQGDGSLSIPVGGPQKQEKVQGAAGEAAATSAKIKATTEGLNAAIDRALAINDKVPSGSYGAAEAQVGLSNLPLVGGGQNAKYAALWHQEIGSNILNGLQQLKGLGRLDIPEVNQVIKTYGLDMEDNPKARKAALENLRQIINNNAAVSQNTTANLNQPGLGNSTARAPVSSQTVTGDTAGATKQLKPIDTDTRKQFNNALLQGKPRAALIQRLQEQGYDTSGF